MQNNKRRESSDISTTSAADVVCKRFWIVRLMVLVILGTIVGQFISVSLIPTETTLQTLEQLRDQTRQNTERLQKIEEDLHKRTQPENR